MPLRRHLPLHCLLTLSALGAQAADQWSNNYVVPKDPPARQPTTPIWSDNLQLPQPAAPAPRTQPRPATSPGTSASFKQLCRPGNRVEALWAGQWYEARVLSADPQYQTCEVTYVGFGKHFDESVNLRRLRPYTGNVTPPPRQTNQPRGNTHGTPPPPVKIPTCSVIPRSDGMGNTSYCY